MGEWFPQGQKRDRKEEQEMKTEMRLNDGMGDFLTPLRGHQGRAQACAPIQVTGYDRNGKVVKSVASDNKGDVENPGSNDRLGFIEREFRI